MSSGMSGCSNCLIENAVLRSLVKVLACIFGVAMTTGIAAQNAAELPQFAPAPATAEIVNSIMADVDTEQFASIFKLSQLSLRDLHEKSVTFFVPKDVYCTAGDRLRLRELATRDAASEYILNHVFLGAVQTLGDRPTRAFSWSEKGQSPFPEQATIDEGHPYQALLASGKSVTISMDDKVLRVGAKAKVVDILYGHDGSIVYIDYCGPL